MNFIFLYFRNGPDEIYFKDLIHSQRVINYPIFTLYKNSVINFIRRVHTSVKVAQYISLPLQKFWYMDLMEMLCEDTCLVFTTMALQKVDLKVLKSLKDSPKHPKMVLLILDSLSAHSRHIPYIKRRIFKFNWDLILSFDNFDCNKYGFTYLGEAYYSMNKDVRPSRNKSDIYYIGDNKGKREQIIKRVNEKLSSQGVRCNFNIVDSSIKDDFIENGIKYYKNNIPYEKVLSDTLASNCILEVVQEGQKTKTGRYYESVCYNKKLLTNNPTFQDVEFYNDQYMRFFNEPEDIDIDWVTRLEAIDYHYNNEFSPIHIIEKINSILEKIAL